MKYSVKFYPEKRKDVEDKTEITDNVPVMLSVSYSGKRMIYYTGKRCNVTQWEKPKSRLKRNQVAPNKQTSREFNADLDEISVVVNDLFKFYDVSKAIPMPDQLRQDIKKKLSKVEITRTPDKFNFFKMYEQYVRDVPLSPGRKIHLTTTLNKIKAFDQNTTFNSLNVQYLTDFQNYLIDTCKISKNTIISELKRLRAFYGYANKHEWTTNYPFKSFTIEAESYGDPVFITVEERDILYNAVPSTQKLERVRDLFVFQCFIGCRVGDLTKLKRSNIVDGCVEYIAGKTKDEKPRIARIPLTDKAKTILSRYDLLNGDLLPFISDCRYNEYLKELFKEVGIKRIVSILDPLTRQSVQKRICDIASSHMARRVFVGSLHHKGVKNEIIASMSGHVENSKAFSRYYSIDKNDQEQAMKLIE